MSEPACPNHSKCNFFKLTEKADSVELHALSNRYCKNNDNCGTCFRSQFFKSYGANLSSDISPNARVIPRGAQWFQASDMAVDQAARLFATRSL